MQQTGRPGLVIRWGFLLVLSLVLSGCSQERNGAKANGAAQKKTPVPVVTAMALEKSVLLELRAIGAVAASASVSINAQVEGELREAHVREGEMVRAGDLLFTIDPRVHAAQLQQAEAALARDQAQLDHARKQAARYTSGGKKGFVSEEQIEQALANVATLDAAIQADRAAVTQARLRLEFCTIRSPITGLAGARLVDPGNLIKAGDKDQPLLSIRQLQPAYVNFSVPERHLPEIRRRLSSGPPEVRLLAATDDSALAKGELRFIDNTVDATTGSIRLQAILANEENQLWPGQFVNVVLALGSEERAVVVPAEAVQGGQQGDYLYVVTPEQRAELRKVAIGRTLGDETVIREGVRPGETVVVRGQLRLTPDSPVKAAEQAAGQKQEKQGS
ncbi:MAG: hypothetical protein BWK76_14365 [Desulfobulbaceae bacterium A2]|nr:MAG: hypothetical protein BWK76_14365 [Desulfobulbaceae bacterium A2]